MSFYYQNDYMNDVIGSGMYSMKIFENMSTKKASGLEKINDSIYTILSTRVGERFFVPEFGSRLYLVLFEPNSKIAEDLIITYIKDALNKWEKRIEVMSVEVQNKNNDNIVPVIIKYRIRNSNLYESYIYPFNVGDDEHLETYNI